MNVVSIESKTLTIYRYSIEKLKFSILSYNSVRGRLGCYTPLARNIGILLAYVVGAAMEYRVIPCIFVVVPILFAIGFATLPNTPQYYLLKGEQKVRFFQTFFIPLDLYSSIKISLCFNKQTTITSNLIHYFFSQKLFSQRRIH